MERGIRLAVVVICCVVAVRSHAQFTPSQDAYTDSAAATTNYGAAGTLGVVSSGGSIQTSYIQFDLSSIPASFNGAHVVKATLKLYVNSVTAAGNFNVDYVSGSWAESTIMNNLAPALGATIRASVPLTTAQNNDYVQIDVTPALQAWLNGAKPNNGFALVPNSPLNATFDSKENSAQGHPPELDVVFTGALTVIKTAAGSGLAGGGGSGLLNLSLSTGCSSGQTLIWNGSAWVCQTPAGSGTVTSVGLSAPDSDFTVTGSPVTGTGTLGFGWIVAPTSASTANAIVKRDSSGSFYTNNITATGQLTINNGTSLNPLFVTANVAGAAAIYGTSMGTGLTNGVTGSVKSSARASSGILGIDGNTGTYGSYTAGVTGFTGSAYGVGVLGYSAMSNLASTYLGTFRTGVWGDDAIENGVVGSSDSGHGVLSMNNSSTAASLYASNSSTGSASWAINSSTSNPTMVAQNDTTESNGIIFLAAAPNVSSNTSSAFCQVTTHGDMGCTGDVYQNLPGNGLVKALIYFDPAQSAGNQIVRCFNSTVAEPTASTPPCGFTYTYASGSTQFNFGFNVSGRFIQGTPVWVTVDALGMALYVKDISGNYASVLTAHPNGSVAQGDATPFFLTVF